MTSHKLIYTLEAKSQYFDLEKSSSKQRQFKAVKKALYFMTINLRHPSLNTHEYTEMSRLIGMKVFESYAENRTAGAYRIFWHYGPNKDTITIISIIPHP
jgi:hypothetical protein